MFEDYPIYTGSDLGFIYSKSKTRFRLWAPTAKKVLLCLYGINGEESKQYLMNNDIGGTWYTEVIMDLKGVKYTYKIIRDADEEVEVVDPYARSLTANGKRGVVIDLSETDPDEWDKDKRPLFMNHTDAIIYEIHVRDFSTHSDSGMKYKGKYLAFTESETVGCCGQRTGLDHLKELGITHVQLLPIQDFAGVDELNPEDYNWGYNPHHYNVPEGSYVTDPNNPILRIKEVKEMVKSLHKAGIRVVMDVVYNHTYMINLGDTIFDMIEPGYFYRQRADGSYSNGSSCGNELASERPMVRKFIIDSLKYWVEEYHIDGFRFDLMALHDIDTMREISNVLHSIDPSILIYGEPWTGGQTVMPQERQLIKGAQKRMSIAVFNDDLRNGIVGYPSDHSRGFATGNHGLTPMVKGGVTGSINYSNELHGFAEKASEVINYVSCHDNLTLWDKIALSKPEDSEEVRIAIDKLCQMIVFTSQGIPFIHGGEEMLRTKNGNSNSFNAGDAINQIDWERKMKYSGVFEYYKGLIKLRREHPAFRMTDIDEIREKLRFIDSPYGTIAFIIEDNANGDVWRKIAVIYNPTEEDKIVVLPVENWYIVVDGEKAGVEILDKSKGKIEGGNLVIPPICGMVLYV